MEGGNESVLGSRIGNEFSLDMDLPYFQSTKYNSIYWRLAHGTTFFLFSIGFLASSVMMNQEKTEKNEKFISHIACIAGSAMYFISSFMEWFHFKRGCCGRANLNSNIKTNIDKSCKAVIYRSEAGIKYFASVMASLILIGASLMVLLKDDDKIEKKSNVCFLIAVSIMFIAQIGKVQRVLKKTKQYTFKNDKSNLTVEVLLMISALIYIVYYSFIIGFNNNSFIKKILNYINLAAAFMLFFSAISVQYRYYISGFQDLNMSGVSFFTV